MSELFYNFCNWITKMITGINNTKDMNLYDLIYYCNVENQVEHITTLVLLVILGIVAIIITFIMVNKLIDDFSKD